jgi:hypothetical protein
MSTATIKIREDRARRALAKGGYRLCKTPSRSWLRSYYGPGYEIYDDRNNLVAGNYDKRYALKLEQVEDFAKQPWR